MKTQNQIHCIVQKYIFYVLDVDFMRWRWWRWAGTKEIQCVSIRRVRKSELFHNPRLFVPCNAAIDNKLAQSPAQTIIAFCAAVNGKIRHTYTHTQTHKRWKYCWEILGNGGSGWCAPSLIRCLSYSLFYASYHLPTSLHRILWPYIWLYLLWEENSSPFTPSWISFLLLTSLVRHFSFHEVLFPASPRHAYSCSPSLINSLLSSLAPSTFHSMKYTKTLL